jgi:hypothetical protein
MKLVVDTQYYRCKSADRQLEIDECLRRNLNHPKVVLCKESDAPPLPEASLPLEVVESNTRITTAGWFRWVKRQGSGIGLLLNAHIDRDEELEHLAATFDTPESFRALTRYNPGHAGFHLNEYSHRPQCTWRVGKSSKQIQGRVGRRCNNWDIQKATQAYRCWTQLPTTCALTEAHKAKRRNVIPAKRVRKVNPAHYHRGRLVVFTYRARLDLPENNRAAPHPRNQLIQWPSITAFKITSHGAGGL